MRDHAYEYQVDQKRRIRNILLVVLLLLLFVFFIKLFDKQKTALTKAFGGVVDRVQEVGIAFETNIREEGVEPVLGAIASVARGKEREENTLVQP